MPSNTSTSYVTTPIYYVNSNPHIGHAYTSIACDIMARWSRLCGNKTYFLSGTDEHGQKVQKSAHNNNMHPIDFCNMVSANFVSILKDLNISNDDFIRTTEKRHSECVKVFWQTLEQNGWIYKGKYEGWYSVRDEAYYSENELIDGKAPTGAEVEWRSEESYFFRLSEFADILLEIFANVNGFVEPRTRLNEVVSFVSGGLEDLCISRTNFEWGIKVPSDESHVIYVWLDALVNYLSALNYPDGSLYSDFWLNCHNKVHIVGKDILRFHAVYWPAFLIAEKTKRGEKINLNLVKKYLPSKIFAHGWWTNKGEKISKSLGNIINPYDITGRYGVDRFRYFLFSSVTFGSDANFNENEFILKTNADLSNNIGNLTQRTLTILHKNFNSIIPQINQSKADSYQLLSIDLASKISQNMNSLEFDKAIHKIIEYASLANEFIDKQAPWSLIKNGQIDEASDVIYVLLHAICQVFTCLSPFIPNSSKIVLDAFCPEGSGIKSGQKISEIGILFPRIL
jgi:methionyl-tRNA synthetase